MKILHLTLKKKWFDMIASSEKTEEYREVKMYWLSRLTYPFDCPIQPYSFNSFDAIQFRNGYSKYAPVILVELKTVCIIIADRIVPIAINSIV